jgi:hypothetical protein
MELAMDKDVQAVVEYMQNTIPTTKLRAVADILPKMAQLLWDKFPQEPCVGVALVDSGLRSDLPQYATESVPELRCAGDDSVAVGGVH